MIQQTLFSYMCGVFITEAKDPTYRSPLQSVTDGHVPSSTASSSPALQPGLMSVFSHCVVVVLLLGVPFLD